MTPGAAFYAPLKPPDDPVPSGDRQIARLFRAAFAEIGMATPLASRFRSRDARGDPERQRRMAALGPALTHRALRSLSREKPSVWFTYHLYYKAADWFGPEAAARLGVPYIVAEASYAPKRAGGPWDQAHRRVAEAVGAAAAVLCLNPNDIPCLEPIAADPARLIHFPPFLDAARFQATAADRTAARAGLARRYGLDDSALWLLAVGMMRAGDKAASYAALARALERMRFDRPWRLVIAGDGPARDRIEPVLQAATGGRAVFLGALDEPDLIEAYRAADLMAWPAVGEAFGMAMLEGQASGLPVVAGRVGGVPAVVADGASGLLVSPGDDAAFAQTLASLLADDDRRRAFGAAGRNRVATEQSLAAAARRLEAVIAGLERP